MLSLMDVKFEKWCHPSNFRNPSMTIESIILQIKGKSSFDFLYSFLSYKVKIDLDVSKTLFYKMKGMIKKVSLHHT